MANGIAYCTMVSDVAIDNGYAYEWMAGYNKIKSGRNSFMSFYLLSVHWRTVFR